MSNFIQYFLMILLVGFSVFFVARGIYRTLNGKNSSLGKCCSKGCGNEQSKDAKPQATADTRTHFMPVEMLQKRYH